MFNVQWTAIYVRPTDFMLNVLWTTAALARPAREGAARRMFNVPWTTATVRHTDFMLHVLWTIPTAGVGLGTAPASMP